MSTSYGTITLTNETEAKKAARYFLHSSGGSYVIAGNSQSFNPSDESTYGFNVRSGTNEIQLRYNNKVLSEWRGGDGTQNSNLVFYDTTNAASTQLALKKLMELTSAGLNFYKKGNDSTAAASLTANGLEIKEGSITLGAEDQTTHRHPFEVNSNGELYAENATISGDIYAAYIEAKSGDIGGWKVTDYIDYELNPSYSAWYVTDYNQTKSFATTYSYPIQEVIPKKVKIKFSGSLNGLNINDDVIYEYDITELDTDYIIEYSGLNVGKAKLTFNGTDTVTFYLTKTLDDGIILELRGLNYILRNNNAGALYYGGLLPGGYLSNIVLSGQGVYSNTTVAGSDPGETWKIAVGNNFGVTTNGTLYATSAKISGHLKAFTLSTGNRTSSSTGTAGTYIDEYGAIYVGSDNAFQVTAAGAVTATSGSIGGWKIGGDTAHSLWYSSSSSVTTPTDALGSGLILSPGGIYSSTKPGGSSSLLPANKTWAFTAGNKFGVTTDGELYGSGANLSNINVGTIAISDVDGLSSALSSAASSATAYIGGRWDPDNLNNSSKYGIAIANSNPSTATNFNFLNADGMKIFVENKKTVAINSNGLYVYDTNGAVLANFGQYTQVGKSSDFNIKINPDGLFFKMPEEYAFEGNTQMLEMRPALSDGITYGYIGSIGNSYTDLASGILKEAYTSYDSIADNPEILFNLFDGSPTGSGVGIKIKFALNYQNTSGIFVNNNHVPVCFMGTTTPSPSTGAIGDIYIKYTN